MMVCVRIISDMNSHSGIVGASSYGNSESADYHSLKMAVRALEKEEIPALCQCVEKLWSFSCCIHEDSYPPSIFSYSKSSFVVGVAMRLLWESAYPGRI